MSTIQNKKIVGKEYPLKDILSRCARIIYYCCPINAKSRFEPIAVQ